MRGLSRALRLKNWTVLGVLVILAAIIYGITVVRVETGKGAAQLAFEDAADAPVA